MAQLPAGMRNNNPGNIKYVGQAGTTPSVNLDQGDPQAVFSSPEAGMAAMYRLLMKKYAGGKITPNMIIASQGGWTPGNTQAAANVAKYAGIGPDDDIRLSDPASAQRFMRALMLQEHGDASRQYSDQMISAAIGGGAAPGAKPGEATVADYRAGNVQPLQPVYVASHDAVPVQDTPAPAAAPTTQVASAEQKKGWRDALAKGMAGFKLPTVAKAAPPSLGELTTPALGGRTLETPMFDPQQMADQRTQLAMAMQKLNAGKLWL